MFDKSIKNFLTSVIIREKQIKITMSYCCTAVNDNQKDRLHEMLANIWKKQISCTLLVREQFGNFGNQCDSFLKS